MKSCILPAITARLASGGRRIVCRVFPVILGILATATVLEAQRPHGTQSADKQLLQTLLQRIEQLESKDSQLEARVRQLEGIKPGPSSPPPAQSAPAATLPGKGAGQTDGQAEPLETEPGETLMKIHGYGDLGLRGDNHKGDTTSFSLGQIDLFITSNISEKFKFLTELVFEQGRRGGNSFEEDLERVLLTYSYNDHLNLSIGRFHTAIGYYNTAYPHATWFQTTADRPFVFRLEDQGGFLPVHDVGVSASGLIPSGGLRLNYIAEIGNGRSSHSPLVQPVQNFVDENNHKAVNLALFARPDAVPGLQVGFSAYRDVLFPANSPRIGESIFDAYAVLVRPKFEWLNEALVIRHAPQFSRHFNTPGFYTQISERFGAYRPYFRYQYVNASSAEPAFPDVGLRQGPSLGVRYEASESVAVKLQYDYTALRRQQAISALALQLGFTF